MKPLLVFADAELRVFPVLLADWLLFIATSCSGPTMGRDMSYICASCGEEHDDLPAIGTAAPFQWSSEYEKETNSLLTPDLCIIEGRDFFVRGVIQIPVRDSEQRFDWECG